MSREIASNEGGRYSVGDGFILPVFPVDGILSIYRIGGHADRYVHVAKGAEDPAVGLGARHFMCSYFGVAYELDLEHLEVDMLAALANILQ